MIKMLNRVFCFSVVIFIAVLLASCSCSKPVSEEMYLNSQQVDTLGRYVFELDLSEPFRSYDLELCINISCNDRQYVRFEYLPLSILWQSPSNTMYGEQVYLGREDYIGGDFFSKQFGGPYRTDLIPVEKGKWKLFFSVPMEKDEEYDLQGIGIRFTKK